MALVKHRLLGCLRGEMDKSSKLENYEQGIELEAEFVRFIVRLVPISLSKSI